MTSPQFIDRKGRPLSTQEWAALWRDLNYRIVAQRRVGKTVIRTVWEGIATVGYLYYTGVSDDGMRSWQTVAHAGTEGGAVATHNRIVTTYEAAAKGKHE